MDNPTAIPQKKRTGIGRVLHGFMQYVIPLGLTVALVWYMFDKVNFSQMMDILHRDVSNLWWIFAAMGVSVFSHIFRAMRWRLQLNALNIKTPLHVLACSIFGTYALNLVFPRLGEVWRCTYISRRQKASFSTVFGSMVADRLADTVTVFLLTVATFLIASGAIDSFLNKYPIGEGLVRTVTDPMFWVYIILGVIVIAVIYRLTRNTRFMKRLRVSARELLGGFAVIVKMPGRGKFLLLTGCIWGCYFLQLYLAFYAFSFTAELCHTAGMAFGLIPCLVTFVVSSLSMAVPSNGGLGPWNIAVIFGLAIYGITETQGTAFSMLVWSAQTVMLIILGIYTMAFISTDDARLRREAQNSINSNSKQ